MAISGPVLAGAVYQRNRTSWVLAPTQNVPVGAMLWLVCACNLPDTATITITDSAGNSYFQQVYSQQPGTIGTLIAFIVPKGLALSTLQSITISSDTRGDLLATLYYFTGAQGSLYSTDVEWSAGAQPSATANAIAGMALFAVLGVAGPNNDGFTQAAGWGADLIANVQTVNATIHAGGRLADAGGPFTYAPTLGANRQSVVLVASFR